MPTPISRRGRKHQCVRKNYISKFLIKRDRMQEDKMMRALFFELSLLNGLRNCIRMHQYTPTRAFSGSKGQGLVPSAVKGQS